MWSILLSLSTLLVQGENGAKGFIGETGSAGMIGDKVCTINT